MITVQNIMKVADIERCELHHDTEKFLKNFLYFEDKVLKEHLYNPAEANEAESFNEQPMHVQEQIAEILTVCGDNDCAYVRIIQEMSDAKLAEIRKESFN